MDHHHNRASYSRNDGSEEWYVNGPLGIEQGFEIAQPPGGTGELVITVDVSGELAPRLEADGRRIALENSHGDTQLHYSDLFVRDARGEGVPAVMDVIDGAIALRIDDRAAQYPLSIDPLVWREQKQLVASVPKASAIFGCSVSVSGDVAIIGAGQEEVAGKSLAGAAYVFARNAGGADNWGLVKRLVPTTSEIFQLFGWSVGVSGDVAVVGAVRDDGKASDGGAAYVFERNAGGPDNWGLVKRLLASDGQYDDWLGEAVAVDGDIIAVGTTRTGAYWAMGSVYLFARNAGGPDNWGEVNKLVPSDAASGAFFGRSMWISGDDLIVGASGRSYDGTVTKAGAAYLFSRNTGGADNWGEVKKLLAPEPRENGYFGSAVSIDGDLALVGEPQFSSNGVGAVHMFARHAGGPNNWGALKTLTYGLPQPDNRFGRSVALSGDVALVGAPGIANDTGAVYVFQRHAGGADHWGQIDRLLASDASAEDYFGGSVALSGQVAFVGAQGRDTAGQSASGAAYVFTAADACSDPSSATIIGTAGDDLLIGTPGDDIIFGLGGDDVLLGEGGHDILCGGAGSDTLRGGDGDDVLDGQSGFNHLFGQNGNDILAGGDDGNELQGGPGDDILDGGAGYDWILGGDGSDVIRGAGGNDDIEAGPGDDLIEGGDGDDWILGEDGDDVIDGGAGDDDLIAGDGNNVVHGGDGADLIHCGAGADTVFGGAGGDYVDGGAGDDLLDGGLGDDSMLGQAGMDHLLGGEGNDHLTGGPGAGSDYVNGGPGDDQLFGIGSFSSCFDGGPGVDSIVCSGGDDNYINGEIIAANCDTEYFCTEAP